VGGAFTPDTYKAEISSVVSMAPGQVEVKFRKARGHISGMEFTGRKSGTSNWANLGRFTVATASLDIPIATPGQPENWEIQGQALRNDKPIGIQSDIKPVTVRG
jgi:hypothetical protein